MSTSLRAALRNGAFFSALAAACSGPGGLDDLPRNAVASTGSARSLVASTNGGSSLGGRGGSSSNLASAGRSSPRPALGGAWSSDGGGGSHAGSDGDQSPSGGKPNAGTGSGGGKASGGANAGRGSSGGGKASGGAPSKAGNGGALVVSSSGAAGGTPEDSAGRGSGFDAAGSAGMGSEPPRSPPFFSEYVEGISSDKALEIVARDAAELSGCSVKVYSNGSLSASHTIALTESVSFSAPLVICTKNLAAASSAGVDAVCNRIEALAFNGNDAVLLLCDDEVVDAIGRLGENPLERWGTEQLGTLDVTLRRDCSIESGDRDPNDTFDLAPNGWSALSPGSFEGLGNHCLEASR